MPRPTPTRTKSSARRRPSSSPKQKTKQFYETQKRLATEHPAMTPAPTPRVARASHRQPAAGGAAPEKQALSCQARGTRAADRRPEAAEGRHAHGRIPEAAAGSAARPGEDPGGARQMRTSHSCFFAMLVSLDPVLDDRSSRITAPTPGAPSVPRPRGRQHRYKEANEAFRAAVARIPRTRPSASAGAACSSSASTRPRRRSSSTKPCRLKPDYPPARFSATPWWPPRATTRGRGAGRKGARSSIPSLTEAQHLLARLALEDGDLDRARHARRARRILTGVARDRRLAAGQEAGGGSGPMPTPTRSPDGSSSSTGATRKASAITARPSRSIRAVQRPLRAGRQSHASGQGEGSARAAGAGL